MMTFAPEVFPRDLALEIASFVRGAEDRDDYSHYGWHNTLHLRSGLFALTRNDEWLSDIVGNLSHHNSSLRRYVARTLAPVMQLLECTEIERAVIDNFEKHHFFNTYPVTLFVAGQGESEYKVRRISEWARLYPNGNDSKLLASFLSDEWVENPFSPQMRRIERYVLLRLCSRPHQIPVQRIARWGQPASNTGLRRDPNAVIDADLILERIESHPLSGEFVRTPKAPS